MKQLLFGIFLLGLFNTASAQEAIYLKYQPNSCVKQYFYKAATNSGSGLITEFFDYHVEWNSQEKTVIRSFLHGEYNKADFKLASEVRTCSQMNSFKSLTPNSKQEIYIVQETASKYLVYKANRISVEKNTSAAFKTENEDYIIDLNRNEDYSPSQKLGVHPTTGTSILFGGKEKNGCHEQFGMVAMPSHACSTQVSLEYVEDVGLYIEKNADGFFMLKKVDGIEVKDYLRSECVAKQSTPSSYNQPLTKGNTVKGGNINNSKINNKVTLVAAYDAKKSNLESGNTAKGGTVIPKEYNQPIKKKVEIVAPFSKKNTSKLNGENTSKGGTAIPKEYNQTTKVKSKGIVVEFPYKEKNIPTEYNAMTQKGSRYISGKAVKYTVRSKDTLYSLSKKYNTTVQELMKWNGLTSQTIYTDQELMVGKVPAPL
jgi:LysM repeat protein